MTVSSNYVTLVLIPSKSPTQLIITRRKKNDYKVEWERQTGRKRVCAHLKEL